MVVGTLEISLRLEGCRSLKDKRQIVRSVLDRLRHDFHASAAEVGDHDLWGNATIGVSVVGSDTQIVESALQKIADVIETDPRVTDTLTERQILRI
ncbi:MAG TPA: DUF503 domain-containing protein [Fimbriimonadaceae bacterium]|nr:DUF503 domain-containing protein [Fimbriimonadaceae bacterium]